MSSAADHTERSVVINAQGAQPYNRITIPFTCEEHVAGREFRSENRRKLVENHSPEIDMFGGENGTRCTENFHAIQSSFTSRNSGRALADFRIYKSYRGVPGQFYGTLEVVRLTDKRVLFPFEGCPEIGPFVDPQSAVDAAQQYGEQLALGDLQNPEF